MLDTPNAFVKTEIALDRENIIIKILRQLVDILIEIFQECMISMSGAKEGRRLSMYVFSKHRMEFSCPQFCTKTSS